MRYDLTKLASKPKGTVVTLPPIEDRLSAALDYRTAMRAILKGLSKELRETVLPIYAMRLEQRKAEQKYTQDVRPEDLTSLIRVAIGLVAVAERAVGRILGLEAKHHTKRWKATVRKALGIDLEAVVREEDLTDLLRVAGLRNAALIKGFGDDAVKRVQRIVADGYLAGDATSKVRKALQADLKSMGSRAELIATDQISKLNADLNRARHEDAGVTQYEWHSSNDERVRERHRKLDGKVYKYGEQTGAEQGLPPGKPIRCRCVALAQVSF